MATVLSDEKLLKNAEETLQLLKEFAENSKVDSSKVIEDALTVLSKSFDFSDAQKESISKTLGKAKLANVESTSSVKMDEADVFILRGFLIKANIKLDKALVDFDSMKLDLSYLIEKVEEAVKKVSKKIRKEVLQSAIERLSVAKKEINASNLAKEAGIEVVDAEKYLKQLETVNKARANNPKLQTN